jgi:transcriptional regulator with XRE-family HTH domain
MRQQRGLRVLQVAEDLGVSPSTYREWEYGRRIQGHEVYLKLCDLFGVSLDELLRGEPGKDGKLGHLTRSIEEIERLLARHKRDLRSFF